MHIDTVGDVGGEDVVQPITDNAVGALLGIVGLAKSEVWSMQLFLISHIK